MQRYAPFECLDTGRIGYVTWADPATDGPRFDVIDGAGSLLRVYLTEREAIAYSLGHGGAVKVVPTSIVKGGAV